MFSNLVITYANPIDLTDAIDLTYQIREHRVATVWKNLVKTAINNYSFDNPNRFTGFDSKEVQIQIALHKINETIDVINNHKLIIDRKLHDITDQDTLNYLHHIFEVYHGLLDNQNSSFWHQAPKKVQVALANLNIQVHECESVGRTKTEKPTHIISWYAMPKLFNLVDDDYKLFESGYKFGVLYLLYAEIGKTLEDLAIDNDTYIFDEAFQPFRHISADFFVTFFDEPFNEIKSKQKNLKKYYNAHQKFFEERGLDFNHNYLKPGYIPLGDLIDPPTDVLIKLQERKFVKSIKLL